MPESTSNGRMNQRHRTRKELLAAAGRLLKQGNSPDMDAVAAEAMVSRATAYRYFPTIEDLLVEAPLDGATPLASDVFPEGESPGDVAQRADRAEAALHTMCYENEAQLRLMLAASLRRSVTERMAGGVPRRQNRRTPLIEAALAPARKQLTPGAYKRLCASLAMIFGTESMIVFQDVLGMDARAARKVKSWAVRALVAAALAESKPQR